MARGILLLLFFCTGVQAEYLKVRSKWMPTDQELLAPKRRLAMKPSAPSRFSATVSVGQSFNLSDQTFAGPSQGYAGGALQGSRRPGGGGKMPTGAPPTGGGGGMQGGPGGGGMMGGGPDMMMGGGAMPGDPTSLTTGDVPPDDPSMMMGGGPGGGGGMMGGGMGGGMMGGGGRLGAEGTSTNVSARASYQADRDVSLNAGVGTTFSDTSLSGGARLRVSDEVSVSGNVMSRLSAEMDPMTLLQTGLNWRASDDVSLGVDYSQMIGYSGIDDSFGVNGPRTPGADSAGLGGSAGDLLQDTATISGRVTYNLSRDARIGLTVPVGFTNGLLDPTAFLNLAVPLEKRVKESATLNFGVGASVPISARSQQESRITTLTGSFGPTLGYDFVTVSLRTQASYALYNADYVTGGTGTDLLRSTNGMSLGLRLSRQVRTQSSASLNFVSRRDGTISWGAQTTPLMITYTPGALGFSAYVSLTSDRTNDQAITSPNQPLVGGSVSYTFGGRPEFGQNERRGPASELGTARALR